MLAALNVDRNIVYAGEVLISENFGERAGRDSDHLGHSTRVGLIAFFAASRKSRPARPSASNRASRQGIRQRLPRARLQPGGRGYRRISALRRGGLARLRSIAPTKRLAPAEVAENHIGQEPSCRRHSAALATASPRATWATKLLARFAGRRSVTGPGTG
jgi:hypothetical protein